MDKLVASVFNDIATPVTAVDDVLCERLRENVLQPAWRAGTTTDVDTYRQAYRQYFRELEILDRQLGLQRFLTEAEGVSASDEWFARLLLLHETVFYDLYKLSERRLTRFQNLAHYMRDVLSRAPISAAFDIVRCRTTFYLDNELINPKRRVPLYRLDLSAPHDREIRFGNNERVSATEEDQDLRRLEGEWKRKTSAHRNVISRQSGSAYTPDPGRYHLYIANNCPWCHRTALTRRIKRLEDIVSMDVLYFRRDPDKGWQFFPDEPGCTQDTQFDYNYIRQLYDRVGSKESSVPVLWDKKTESIVSNESAEIIRMFDSCFGALTTDTPVLVPKTLEEQIDRVNAFTYHAINNGAYKAGFADSQTAYEAAYRTFFDALDVINEMLRGRPFLLGDELTEADVRLFPTIYRFDPVYYTRFDLNERMIVDCPAVQQWLERMLDIPEVAAASNLDHCRQGYFGRTGNNIVPLAAD